MNLLDIKNRLNLSAKLITAMLLVGLVPLAITSYLNSQNASTALRADSVDKLHAVSVIKKTQVEEYFQNIRNQLSTFAEDIMVVEAMQNFDAAFDALPNDLGLTQQDTQRQRQDVQNFYRGEFSQEYAKKHGGSVDVAGLVPSDARSVAAQYLYMSDNPNPLGQKGALVDAQDGSSYSEHHERYHEVLLHFQDTFGYYDIFMVDLDGNVVYSVLKQVDFGTNLNTGPYSNSNLGRLYKQVVASGAPGQSDLIDFETYLPSYDGPASFMATPVHWHHETMGVLVFKMPMGQINHIMEEQAGLGETGATFLVGEDKLMRSQSRFKEENTVLAYEIDTPIVDKALNGESGDEILIDHRGLSVLSTYLPLDIPGVHWALIAEIEEEEALHAVSVLIRSTLLVALAAVAVVGAIAFFMARSISRPVVQAVGVAQNISEGNYDNEICTDSHDEVGMLLNALGDMQTNLRNRIEADQKALAENTRIRHALNKVSSSVVIADNERDIIFVNDAGNSLFSGAEAAFRTELPNFNAKSLLGSSIDSVEKDPANPQAMPKSLNAPHRAEIRLGGKVMQTVASPVIGEDGTRYGTVLEWTDRTAEVAIEEEVQEVVNNAIAGNLGARIDMTGKDGFFGRLSSSMNDLVGVADKVIGQTVEVVSAMAQGDLTKSIDGDYEGSFAKLKNDVNATAAKLTSVVGNIQSAAMSVKSGADEISQGNTNLSQRTEEQASSLEETASSMEEMTSTVKQNADNAVEANQLASAARDEAEKGGSVVRQAVDAMNAISDSSKKISDIIGVIDEIAFQTNLLALNASVEAARAGEQGRGFAVVASEVRNLAGRSATAAKEIKDLIKDSGTKVEEGARLVNESGETLGVIVDSVKKVSDIVGEIAAASQEQSAGIEEVNRAIVQLDELTQQNAALVEEAAAASESMGDQADDLQGQMLFFQVAQASGGAAPVREAPARPNGVERRSAERPWSGGSSSADDSTHGGDVVAAAPPPKAANGSAGDQWEEF